MVLSVRVFRDSNDHALSNPFPPLPLLIMPPFKDEHILVSHQLGTDIYSNSWLVLTTRNADHRSRLADHSRAAGPARVLYPCSIANVNTHVSGGEEG